MTDIIRAPKVRPGRKASPVRVTRADGTVTEQGPYDAGQLRRIREHEAPGVGSAQRRALREAVEAVCAAVTPRDRGRARHAALTLAERGATAADVRARAARFRGPGLTPAKLLRLWDRLG